ncbi:MAG: hypothetical protein QM820_00600 [Minicystis sp.]
MSRYATLLLLLVIACTAACAQILGLRVDGRSPFPHRPHVLAGATCTRCHTGIASAGDEGPLHLPTNATCSASDCHKEPHHANRPCDSCHGLPSTRAGAAAAREHLRFEHKTHMPRAFNNCPRCHVDIESGAAVLRPRMATCASADCHDADRRRINNHADQIAENKCDPCHVDIRDENLKPDDHLIHAGNFLREHGVRAAADRATCATCHAERFCVGCHGVTVPALPERLKFDDPRGAGVHRAGFKARHPDEARGDPGLCTTCHSPSVCKDCHDREKLSATTATKSPHPRGWLGLRGQPNDHGRAAWREPELCASCHGGAGEMLCVGCHKVGGIGGNPHSATFDSRRRPKTDRPCRLCHAPQ